MKGQKTYKSNPPETSMILGNPYSLNSKPSKVIKENSSQNISFNIMPNKDVKESVKVKEYRLWDNAIETLFDRSYNTDMKHSPNHLTFLSSLTNLQKMVYVFMHHYLAIKYDKNSDEKIKVWPGKLEINMPKMIMKKNNLQHLMVVSSVTQLKENRYKICADTTVGNIVSISGEALVIVL